MINIWIIIGILILHWISDFLLQSDDMALNKSKSNKWLTRHIAVYSFLWFVASLFFASATNNIWFMLFWPITFVCHWITDYFTSRLNSKLWAEKKTHWFFVSVGFDQILHYIQLFVTYLILRNG